MYEKISFDIWWSFFTRFFLLSIEMVAVVDNMKGKKYKAIKVEDEKDVKTRKLLNTISDLGTKICPKTHIQEFEISEFSKWNQFQANFPLG